MGEATDGELASERRREGRCQQYFAERLKRLSIDPARVEGGEGGTKGTSSTRTIAGLTLKKRSLTTTVVPGLSRLYVLDGPEVMGLDPCRTKEKQRV